jgi:hypothetical protein
MYEKTRAEGFGAEVKRRIMIGAYVLSHGYYDAYYIQAQKLRRLIAQDFAEAYKACDVILGPTAPTTAFKLGEKADDPVQMYLSDIYTIAVNLAGLPGMSLPCGFDGQGLPIGLQLIGDYFSEARMLNVAHQYQLATDWHQRTPGGFRSCNGKPSSDLKFTPSSPRNRKSSPAPARPSGRSRTRKPARSTSPCPACCRCSTRARSNGPSSSASPLAPN